MADIDIALMREQAQAGLASGYALTTLPADLLALLDRLEAAEAKRDWHAEQEAGLREDIGNLEAELRIEGEKNLRHEARLMEERDRLAAVIERIRAYLDEDKGAWAPDLYEILASTDEKETENIE